MLSLERGAGGNEATLIKSRSAPRRAESRDFAQKPLVIKPTTRDEFSLQVSLQSRYEENKLWSLDGFFPPRAELQKGFLHKMLGEQRQKNLCACAMRTSV